MKNDSNEILLPGGGYIKSIDVASYTEKSGIGKNVKYLIVFLWGIPALYFFFASFDTYDFLGFALSIGAAALFGFPVYDLFKNPSGEYKYLTLWSLIAVAIIILGSIAIFFDDVTNFSEAFVHISVTLVLVSLAVVSSLWLKLEQHKVKVWTLKNGDVITKNTFS